MKQPLPKRIRRQRWSKDREQKARALIFKHYGSVCICCGESEPKFLQLDHVNNDGYLEKNEKAMDFYLRIIRRRFPDSYQILCANCNSGRERNGGICPHKGIILEGPPKRNGHEIRYFPSLPLFDGASLP